MKCSANFKDGNYNVLVIEYFNDGSMKSKGRYINGSKIGKWILNFDDGSYEHKTYSRKRPDEVRKSLLARILRKKSVLKLYEIWILQSFIILILITKI